MHKKKNRSKSKATADAIHFSLEKNTYKRKFINDSIKENTVEKTTQTDKLYKQIRVTLHNNNP